MPGSATPTVPLTSNGIRVSRFVPSSVTLTSEAPRASLREGQLRGVAAPDAVRPEEESRLLGLAGLPITSSARAIEVDRRHGGLRRRHQRLGAG